MANSANTAAQAKQLLDESKQILEKAKETIEIARNNSDYALHSYQSYHGSDEKIKATRRQAINETSERFHQANRAEKAPRMRWLEAIEEYGTKRKDALAKVKLAKKMESIGKTARAIQAARDNPELAKQAADEAVKEAVAETAKEAATTANMDAAIARPFISVPATPSIIAPAAGLSTGVIVGGAAAIIAGAAALVGGGGNSTTTHHSITTHH